MHLCPLLLLCSALAAYALEPEPVPLLDVADQYIVSLKQHVDLDQHISAVQRLIQANQSETAFKGVMRRFKMGSYQAYSAHVDSRTAEQLRLHRDVKAVQPNAPLEVQDMDEGECDTDCQSKDESMLEEQEEDVEEDGIGHVDAPPRESRVLQRCAPYNLHRISHRGMSDTSTYWYVRTAGRGAFAYVIDGGIDPDHVEFGGRVQLGFNAFGDYPPLDRHGHGTYIAGIIGGKWYGVAKKTTLISVKAIHHGHTTLEMVLTSYHWAVEDIMKHQRVSRSVISISVCGDMLSPLNDAIDEAYSMGIVTVVPAGNGGKNVLAVSPSSAKGAITVGATDQSRARVGFSNWGKKVQIFAPGYKVCSAWVGLGNKKSRKGTGTGVAAAHVAGLVVYFKSFNNLYNAEITWSFIQNVATVGVVKNAAGSVDLFAYNLSGR